MNDYSLELREAIVSHFQDTVDALLIPDTQICGLVVPDGTAWPFSRIDPNQSFNYEESCGKGMNIPRFRISVFAKGDDERNCAMLCRAFAESVETFEMPDPYELRTKEFLNQQIFADQDETDGWHGIIDFDMTVFRRYV